MIARRPYPALPRAFALALALSAGPGFWEAWAQQEPAPQEVAQEAVGDAGDSESKEKFSDFASRIFLKAIEGPSDVGELSGELEAVCEAPSSKEPLDQAVYENFAALLEKSWRRPEGAKAAETPAIMLEVCLGGDGRSLRQPFLVDPSGALEPRQAQALLLALDAVSAAAPLAAPPPEEGPWRRILVLFDPLKGGSASPGAAK